MADPKAPDEPEYVEVACPHCETLLCVDLDELRVALMAIGLAIVTEADRKVLEAADKLPTKWLDACVWTAGEDSARFAQAELEARKMREK